MLRSGEYDVLTFDPTEIERLWEQDAIYLDYGYLVDTTWQWTATGPFAPPVTLAFDGDSAGLEATSRAATLLASRPRYRGNDDEFARYLRALRMAVSFPLNGMLVSRMRLVLDVAEEEMTERIKEKRERARRKALYGDANWESADLVAEVAAVAGEGQAIRGEVWFHCPLGHRDSDASLHVNRAKRTWHCFGCQAGGGVVDWRKTVARS